METCSVKYLETLGEISSAIVRTKNAAKLFERILSALGTRFGMQRGMFMLLRDGHMKIEAYYSVNEDEESDTSHTVEKIALHVAETGRAHLIHNTSRDPRFPKSGKKQNTAFICVPIIRDERVIGTLAAEKQAESADIETDAKLLEIIGNIAAETAYIYQKELEERESLIAENKQLRVMLDGTEADLIGNCRSMKHVYKLIRQVATSSATVLIRGETGTGKELAAHAIVSLSERKNKPFVILNCATLPDNLLESELFGYEKGAFTGALSRKQGRAELANGGTLFLDEIGDLTPAAQVKLLRFIQNHTFSRLGGTAELHADVRLIAATSRNLEELMAQGKFREDLYYRLNVFPITMPSLNKRRCDIVLLAEHFIEKYNIKYNRTIKRITVPAINMLMNYIWPGNVRELENCIERAVLTSHDNVIKHYDLPPSLRSDNESDQSATEALTLNELVDAYEKTLINDALKRYHGNMSAAARELGLSPRVIHYKINRLEISVTKE